ncbi:S-layer homology domain-containing protein [Candidatus Pseudoscillospira sp. SGI.172]|uniref:S-layer homology domain-containing protein n=1 Tax=Candidatus Pseudoscillospira sp. SGI.172 TaxID=3420582 RepID=UPI003D0174AF
MNNLKRVLSLGLTGAMLTGMMVMGASAAKFNDADKITHTEAVNTMVALGVLKGKDTGNYDPQGIVTRAEMAKIICVALNGGEDPTLGVKATPTYKDIKGHWAESYIEYCSSIGVIAGQGDGTFAPDATVTGSAAAKMFLVALGYDTKVFGFTGMDWEINTNVQANDAKLYDDLKGMNASAGLTRDNAAQMAFNAMEAKIMEKSYDSVASTGEVTYKYALSTTTTFLNEYFDAYTFIGTYEGNKDTGAANVDGQIKVIGRLDTESAVYDDKGAIKNDRSAYLPSDLDISNIGEEVKVIFKDGKSGTTKTPDKNDTIYGVFNTGKTEVYNVTKNDIQDAESETKVKFGDAKYDLASSVKVVTNYITDDAKTYEGKNQGSELQKALKVQSGDTIKFVANDDGKIYAAYVTEYKATKVTGVTSSKVTLSGVGAIDIDDNHIYEGIAKDDVVVYTKFYDADKDDATFTVVKAETVTGELTSFKDDDKNTTKVTVSGTTYKVHNTLVEVTDDSTTKVDEEDIGEDVVIYLVNGLVAAVDVPDTTTNSYAVVTGFNGGTVDATYDAMNVKVLMSDGSTAKYDVHKDSTYDGSNKIKDLEDSVEKKLFENKTLIKYTMSGNEIKIKDIVDRGDGVKVTLTTGDNNSIKLWNKDNKSLTLTTKNNAVDTTAVASSDAVLYVYVGGETDKWYTYSLRSLGNINITGDTALQYYLKDGQVVAACVELSRKPGSNTADTLYGIVTDYNGTTKISGDTYYSYSVWTGEDKTVYVDSKDATKLATGNIVTFDETSDGQYTPGDFTVYAQFSNGAYTFKNVGSTMAVAVDSYSANKGILTYFAGTSKVAGSNPVTYVGTGDSKSLSVADDVVIVYVDGDEQDKGSDNGVASFDTTTGYANAIVHKDSDGVVDAIIVETSGKKNFGSAPAEPVSLKNDNKTIEDSEGKNGAYTVTVPEKATVGASFDVTVKCTSVDEANAKGEVVTVTYGAQEAKLTFEKAETQTATFTAVSEQTSVSATVKAAE